jgi:hypothetical protein
MCHHPTPNPPEETSCQCSNKHVKRHARTAPQFLLRESRNVEVWHDVAKEVAEGTRRKEDEQLVFGSGGVEESAAFSGVPEDGGSGEEGREGEESASEGDETDCADGPGEARAINQLIELDNVNYSASLR